MTLVEFSAKKYYLKEKGIQTSYRHNGVNLECVNGVWVFEKRSPKDWKMHNWEFFTLCLASPTEYYLCNRPWRLVGL